MTDLVLVFSSLVLSFAIGHYSIPSILAIAREKHLYDEPGTRKVNKRKVPTLGGAAIFLALTVSTALLSCKYHFAELPYIMVALTILFYIGIKDDILDVSAKSKSIIQLVSTGIIIFVANLYIRDFHGFITNGTVLYWIAIVVTTFMVMLIINAFNLIDGIDGLASGIGIVSSATFTILFVLRGEYTYAIFSASLVGVLISFFRYNVFEVRNKLFMGDTGSMLVGLSISIMTIKYLNAPAIGEIMPISPSILYSVIAYPLTDTLRVFFIRIKNGHSPFKPDKNHIHHSFLKLGYKHYKATFTILGVNVGIILISFAIQPLTDNETIKLFTLMIISLLVYSIPFFMLKRRKKADL